MTRWHLRDIDARDDRGKPREIEGEFIDLIAYLRGPLWNDTAPRAQDDLAEIIDRIETIDQEPDEPLEGEQSLALQSLERRYGVRLKMVR